MTPEAAEAHCVGLVKQSSPARYVSALFAEVETRRFLYALYAFDLELAQVRQNAHEPMIAAMRFQWWRDAIEALPAIDRGHPVLSELVRAIKFGALGVEPLIPLVDAWETHVEPAVVEVALVTLAARICGAAAGPNALADATAIAIATRSPAFLAEARRLWREQRRTRRQELPAYLPATFVDAPHPVTDLALRWRVLRRGLAGRF